MREHDTSAVQKELAALGYHRSVLTDEVHAYLVAPSDRRTAPARALIPLQKELRTIFRQHAADLRVP